LNNAISSRDFEAGVYQELPEGWEYFWENGIQKVVRLDKKGKLDYDTPDRWDCRACGNSFTSHVRPKRICTKCEECDKYNQLTPFSLDEPWIPYNRPILSDSIDFSLQDIIGIVRDFGKLQKDIEYQIAANWCVATYFYDQFRAFPYLQFWGVIDSGKSRMLRMLSWFAYRPILHASCSASVMVREIDEFHPTILIDEINTKINFKTETGKELYNVLYEGYKSGSDYARCKQGKDRGTVRHKVYSPKAFAGRKVVDKALSSRCIDTPMRKAIPNNEDLPEELPELVQTIRSKLLGMKLIGIKLPVPEVDLHGRTREKFLPIIAVEQYFNGEYSDIVEYAKRLEDKQTKEMKSTLDADILDIIHHREMDDDKPNTVRIKTIAILTGESSQKIGLRVSGMGIPVDRDKVSTFIDKDDPDTQDVLNDLWKRHGIIKAQTELPT